MAEQKAVCGGFLVGDGLEMNGKVLSATGGGSGVKYVECHTDPTLSNIECELTPAQIIDLVNNGETVILKLKTDNDPTDSSNYLTLIGNSTVEYMAYFGAFNLAKLGSSVMGRMLQITVIGYTGQEQFVGAVTSFTVTQ